MSRSQLDYASVIWNPYKEKYNEQIEKVQRRATKTLPSTKLKTFILCRKIEKAETSMFKI